MKSFVTEQHNKGVDLPDEFGVHVANKTKIMQKKKLRIDNKEVLMSKKRKW